MALLRAFLKKAPAPPLPAGIDLDRLLEIAHAQGVAGVCGYLLQHDAALPEKRQMQLATLFYRTVFQLSKAQPPLEAWRRKLAAAGIPHALLKGAVLQALYPVPELRLCGDADFFVPPAFLPQLKALLTAENVTLLHEDDTVIYVHAAPLYLEFHPTLLPDAGSAAKALAAYFGDAAAHMTGDPLCRDFEPEFHFIYLLSHQMRHFQTDCPGIRTFMDLAVFLQHFPAAPTLAEKLRDLGLYDYAAGALALTARWFDVPSPLPVTVSDGDADAVAAYILSVGLFAREQNAAAAQMEQQMSHAFPRLRTLWRALFPLRATLEKDLRYGALAKKCLPAAYAKRFFVAVFTRRDHIHDTARSIATATADAQKRVQMQQILHLK